MSIAEILSQPARVELRPLAIDDAEALYEGFSDPEVMRYWSTPPHTSLEQTEAWVRAAVESAASGQSIEMAVLHEGKLAGRVGFWRGDEVGFLFLRRAWGKAIAREAVARVIDHAFRNRDWSRVIADVDPLNERCLRMLAALGFRETGRAERTWCVGGQWVGSVYLELMRPG